MGTMYGVACRDCKVKRDLDKFDALRVAMNRAEAMTVAKRIEADSFRAALLVSFMWEHATHNCTTFSEHHETMYDETKEFADDDRDFWNNEPP